jgi:hypothetical protein
MENLQGETMSVPICPILSVRNENVDELCLEEQCALYIPSAKKCSVLYIGMNSLMQIQQAQQAAKKAQS